MVDMHLLQTGVSLNLKMRARFQIQTSLKLEPDFEYGRKIQIQTQGGKWHMLGRVTKVGNRHQSL